MRAVHVARVLVGLAMPSLALAQVPAQLTLDDALSIARTRNPAYLRAVALADASGAEVRAGFGAFLPSLSANLSWSGNSRTIITGEDDFGQPVRLPDPLTFRSSAASQSVSSSLVLFDGLQNFNSWRAARAGASAAVEGVSYQAAAIDAEVSRRFYTALQARRLIEVEEQLLSVSRQQLDATERLFRVAARTEVDVLGAQVQVAQQEQELERARGEARKAELRLAEQMGLDEGAEFEVIGALPPPFNPALLSQDSLLARATLQSPRIGQAAANAAEAQFAARAARGRRWPSVSARASFGRGISLSSYDALFDFNPQDRSFGFGIDVQVPLFTGFQTSLAIAQANAQAEIADENLREARLLLERDVQSAHIDLVTAHRRLELAQRAVEFSRRRLTMAQQQYQLGTIGFTEFQQIVTSASQDARSLISAELEFAQAAVTMEELVGEAVRP
ncbi:MAG: TolC family protein [Gemmatimonadota bacterium]|nr:TolC family protein [Gemmatimonadota bacterium]